MTFPADIPVLTNPASTQTQKVVPHSAQHQAANDNIEGLAAKMGSGASLPVLGTFLTTAADGTSVWGNAIGAQPALAEALFADTRRLAVGGSLSDIGTAGSGHDGTANEWLVTITANAADTAAAGSTYQKNALRVEGWTSDTSSSDSSALRDMVAGHFAGYINSGVAFGRAWGIYARAEILSGSDGHAIAFEGATVNVGGTDQATPGTHFDKIAFHAAAEYGNGTVAFYANASVAPGGYWHKGFFAWTTVIGTGGSDAFVDLYDPSAGATRFRIRQSGATKIDLSAGTETALTIVGNNSAVGYSQTNTGSNGARMTWVGNGSTTPSKTWRVKDGVGQWLNDAADTVILQLSDTGVLSVLPAIQPRAAGGAATGTFGAYSADATGTVIQLQKSRHATLGSHAAVQTNDVLGSVIFYGDDGSAFQQGAKISAAVTEVTPSSSAMGSALIFYTSAAGSVSPTERFRIAAAGTITLADAVAIAVGSSSGTKIGTATTQKLGFWNHTPAAQQTVTGSRGGNAALASLLTALAATGIVVDSSSA